MKQDEFIDQARHFLENIFQKMESKNIFLKEHWNVDHLCFRVSSIEKYEKYKQIFSNWSQLLIESEINGRMIASYKLNAPILFKHYKIEVVELPAPKPGSKTPDGFEHIEVVCDLSFSEIKKLYPLCDFNESGLNKSFNQDIKVQLNGFALKFHHMSLESVIAIEKK
jgi:uncharacterized protein